MKKYMVGNDGVRIRVGPIAKSELSDAYGCLRSYFYSSLVHKNEKLMSVLERLGYRRTSKNLTHREAQVIARYYDLFIEGVYDASMDECLIELQQNNPM